jgi:hypothetical protein
MKVLPLSLMFVALVSADGAARAIRAPDAASAPAPKAPSAEETPTQIPVLLQPVSVSSVAVSSDSISALLDPIFTKPDALGLKRSFPLRLDYVQRTSAPSSDILYVRYVQQALGVDVFGGELVLTLQSTPEGSRITAVSGRLYPEAEQATPMPERASLERDNQNLQGAAAPSPSQGVYWLSGRWRAVQLFRLTDSNQMAAGDAQGRLYTWDTRIY